MKRMMLGLLAVFALAGSHGVAAQSAGGEIVMHIETVGIAEPDMATVTLTARGVGTDEQMARAALDGAEAAIDAQLDSAGIPKTARELGEIETNTVPDYATQAAADAALAAGAAADARSDYTDLKMEAAAPAVIDVADAEGLKEAPMVHQATRQITVTVTDLSKLEAVLASGSADDGYSPRPRATYTTRDPKAAHTRAVQAALANARAEADAYAAAMGYRVVRVVRVSSEKPSLNWPDVVGLIGKGEMGGPTGREGMNRLAGSTFAGAQVDYAIAPK